MYRVTQQPRAVNVDLQTDATLQVDISDALSERDKVKFTVHTKVSLFSGSDLQPRHVMILMKCSHGSTEHPPQLQAERVLRGPTARGVHLAARLIRRE